MLTLPSSVRIWLCTGAVDLRKGFDGLAAIVRSEVRRDKDVDQQRRLEQRRANAQSRSAKLQTEPVDVPVPKEQCRCPKCNGTEFSPLGEGKPSSVIEYISGYFRKARGCQNFCVT